MAWISGFFEKGEDQESSVIFNGYPAFEGATRNGRVIPPRPAIPRPPASILEEAMSEETPGERLAKWAADPWGYRLDEVPASLKRLARQPGDHFRSIRYTNVILQEPTILLSDVVAVNPGLPVEAATSALGTGSAWIWLAENPIALFSGMDIAEEKFWTEVRWRSGEWGALQTHHLFTLPRTLSALRRSLRAIVEELATSLSPDIFGQQAVRNYMYGSYSWQNVENSAKSAASWTSGLGTPQLRLAQFFRDVIHITTDGDDRRIVHGMKRVHRAVNQMREAARQPTIPSPFAQWE